MSPGLQATLLRARDYAAGQSGAQVLLEHLLLSLSEDADATQLLEVCNVDLGRLRNDVAGYLGTLDDRVAPGTPGAPAISQPLTQVLRYATLAAQQGRRSSIDGAIVLAALVGDGRSMAANFLKAQGLTFEAAIHALRQAAARGNGAVPASQDGPAMGAQPAYADPLATTTSRAEDILARARERVETRNQQRPEPPRQESAPQAEIAPDAPVPLPTREAVPEPPPPPMSSGGAEATGNQSSGSSDLFVLMAEAEQRRQAATQPSEPAQNKAPPPASPSPKVDASASGPNEAPAPFLSTNDPASTPGDGAGPSKVEVPAAPSAVAPPVPPEPPPEKPAPSNLQHTATAPPERSQPPSQTPQGDPSQAPAGWAPPPVRPAPPSPPSGRPLPPPPQGWSAPPPPAGQPPRRSGSYPSHLDETEQNPPPAHWSRPPTSPDARHELPPGGTAPSALVPAQAQAGAGGAGAKRPAIDPSQITHSIPRRLRQGRSHVVEIWIERPPIAAGSPTRSFALRSENVVARAIAVRLRPLAGRFVIDAASPETQWDQSGAAGTDRLASEAAVWRFTLTPVRSGRGVLQLAISARTLGADGVLAETQIPDQTFNLRVGPSYWRLLGRIFAGLGVAMAGMVLIKLVEGQMGVDFYYMVRQLLRLQF